MFASGLTGPNGIATVITAAILLHLKDCSGVSGITLAPVYWNLTNPIFKTSKNDHIIVVNVFDEIDFICPHYPLSVTDSNHFEYYLIYRVSKKEYDDCNIYSENATFLILRCTHPRQKRRFTILFEPFQSIPNVPEYKAGHTYYFMTPSTGRKNGLRNLYQGACLQHNMKLTVKVRDGDYEIEEIPHVHIQNETVESQGSVETQDKKSGDVYEDERIKKGLQSSQDPGPRRHFITRTTRTIPIHHAARTPKISPKNQDRMKTQRLSHTGSVDSASFDDGQENLEAFLKSRNELPSSVQESRASSSLRRSPNETKFIRLAALVTIAATFGRWSHV